MKRLILCVVLLSGCAQFARGFAAGAAAYQPPVVVYQPPQRTVRKQCIQNGPYVNCWSR